MYFLSLLLIFVLLDFLLRWSLIFFSWKSVNQAFFSPERNLNKFQETMVSGTSVQYGERFSSEVSYSLATINKIGGATYACLTETLIQFTISFVSRNPFLLNNTNTDGNILPSLFPC